MASTIAAVTTSGGGVVTTADASGNLNLLAGTTTVVALTTAGAAVSGTLSSTTGATFATSSGSVGIGTSSPSSKLHVVSSSGENKIISEATAASQQASMSLIVQAATPGQTVIYMGKTGATTNGQLGYDPNTNAMTMFTNNTERMRIDSSGNLLVGTTSASGLLTVVTSSATAGTRMVAFSDSNARFSGFYEGADGITFNAANTVLGVREAGGTGRSINASGTVNASGADYAEYMTKAGDFTVAKGDVVGIDANGQLTNIFDKALSFVVKSTNPSYVGGDVWGTEEALGMEKPADDASDEEKIAFDAALEAARQSVDRIAFAGQVPVNVLGATAGQYILPVNDNGAIKGQAVSNPTFEQYQIAVGKVIAIESDGRAKIIVKVA